MNRYFLRKRKFNPLVVSMSNHDRNQSITFKETAIPSTSSGRTVGLIRASLMFLLLAMFDLLPAAQADELGRLFFTPQQRQQLEYRDAGSNEEGGRRNYIIVNGVVQKQGGNRTVWINGAAQSAGRGNDKTPSTVPVNVPGKSRPVQLKVGQRLMLEAAPEENK